jgi:hypothetical protein
MSKVPDEMVAVPSRSGSFTIQMVWFDPTTEKLNACEAELRV